MVFFRLDFLDFLCFGFVLKSWNDLTGEMGDAGGFFSAGKGSIELRSVTLLLGNKWVFCISGVWEDLGLQMEGKGREGGLGEKSSISWWWWWGFCGKKKGCSAASEMCLERQEARDERKMREILSLRRFSMVERESFRERKRERGF